MKTKTRLLELTTVVTDIRIEPGTETMRVDAVDQDKAGNTVAVHHGRFILDTREETDEHTILLTGPDAAALLRLTRVAAEWAGEQ